MNSGALMTSAPGRRSSNRATYFPAPDPSPTRISNFSQILILPVAADTVSDLSPSLSSDCRCSRHARLALFDRQFENLAGERGLGFVVAVTVNEFLTVLDRAVEELASRGIVADAARQLGDQVGGLILLVPRGDSTSLSERRPVVEHRLGQRLAFVRDDAVPLPRS